MKGTHLFKANFISITVLGLFLVACTGTLVWRIDYTANDLSVVGDSLMDQQGNIYVAGTVRVAADPNQMNGLLLKYDANGELIWEREFEDASHIASIQALTDDYLIAGTFNSWHPTTPPRFELISALDGTTVMTALENSEYSTLEIATHLDNAYLAINRWGGEDVYQLTRMPLLGAEPRYASAPGSIVQFGMSPSGVMYVLSENDSHKLTAYSNELELLWEIDLPPFELALSDRFSRIPSKFSFDQEENIILVGYQTLIKISNQGEIIFNKELDDWFVPGELTEKEVHIGPSHVTTDETGDIYLTTTRSKRYIGDLGNVFIKPSTISRLGATLGSDTLVFRINGSSGNVDWMTELTSTLESGDTGVISSFRYPLSISIVNKKLQVTVRQFTGEYVNSMSDETGSYCFSFWNFLPFAFNSCRLEAIVDRNAQTYYYSLDNGEQETGSEYNIPQTSHVFLDQQDNTIIVGDDSREYTSDYFQVLTYGVVSDDKWIDHPDSYSKIIIEKHKLP